MNPASYSFDEFKSSSSLIRALLNENDQVKPFLNAFFNEEAIMQQATSKMFAESDRLLLVEALERQNKHLPLSEKTVEHIQRLKERNVFTITTGHQLNMATGPLYTLYKIIEVINWCEKLNSDQSDKYFVPVFWMATEDHDFEEINHINLFGQKIGWQHQSAENSIVGRINTKPAGEFVNKVLEKFRDEDLKDKISSLLDVYNDNSLAQANRVLINKLFGEYGLVIIDGDDVSLKSRFKAIAEQEITEGLTFKNVDATNEMLDKSGFHQQVFVRQSNLFYIEPNGERVRIEKEGNSFIIKDQKYSKTALVDLLKQFPERFSPNALLRPVYQELVLPNITYVGGGGEIAYWLQLKSTFKALKVQFPLLKVRDSVLLVDDKMSEQMDTFGYSILELKGDLEDLKKDFVTKNQSVELTLVDQIAELNNIKQGVLGKALLIDKNATPFIEAEFQRMVNQIEKMEKKFISAEKKNQEKSVKQLERLKNRFYPNGGFQERYDNYLSYIHYPNFINDIKNRMKQKMATKAAIYILSV